MALEILTVISTPAAAAPSTATSASSAISSSSFGISTSGFPSRIGDSTGAFLLPCCWGFPIGETAAGLLSTNLLASQQKLKKMLTTQTMASQVRRRWQQEGCDL